MSEYTQDRAVRPVPTAEPGRFTVELDVSWPALSGVANGAYSTAVPADVASGGGCTRPAHRLDHRPLPGGVRWRIPNRHGCPGAALL